MANWLEARPHRGWRRGGRPTEAAEQARNHPTNWTETGAGDALRLVPDGRGDRRRDISKKEGRFSMTLRISGKHMDIGEAFRGRIEARIDEAVSKYFDGRYSGQTTVTKAGSRYKADCTIHLDSGLTLQASGDGQEPVAAFETAAEHLEKRVRRYKRRLKSHGTGAGNGIDISYTVVAGPDEDEDIEVADDFAPAIVAESTVALKTMSVASAVIELDTKDSPVVVFRNAGNESVNIVYRRPDGNIGWIDPSKAARG